MSSIYSADYQRILDVLKQAREERKVTQQSLAQALKRPQSFISKYESGERRLDVVEFVRIAELLGLDLIKIVEMLCIGTAPLTSSRKYDAAKKN